jgi:predicted metal-binding protein
MISRALAYGFTHAGALDAATLNPRAEVRAMCAADRCGAYGKNWVCPPHCGDLEENRRILKAYKRGLLVQTTAVLKDAFDYKTMEQAGKTHKALFHGFMRELRRDLPALLALGSGGCDLCPQCTCPDAPCRRPGEAVPSMEAFGLMVSDACAANGLPYYYGKDTLTYTACFLY